MPIVFQQVVAADNKYTFTNSPANTVFDIHNDSPYNMGISFGHDTGIQAADYYTDPHSILYGSPVPGQQPYTVGGVKFAGTVYIYTQTPLTGSPPANLNSAPASSITILGYPAGSQPQGSTSLNRMVTTAKAVNTNPGSTTEKPIFAATVGFGATATKYQTLNIFNPPGSGVNFTFYAARVFTNDSTTPAVNLITLNGADLNLGTAVPALSHDATASPPVSFAHCTAEDLLVGHGGNIIEVLDCQANVTLDFLTFPDSVVVAPGNNLFITLTSGTTAHVVRLTMKWSEDVPTTLQGGVPTSVATEIINQNNPAPTPVVLASPAGDSGTAVQINNDGTATFGDASNAALLTILGSLAPTKSTTVNGSVGGQVNFKTPIWGPDLKILLITFGNYNSAGSAVFTLPGAIGRGLWISSYNGTSTVTFGGVDVATSLGTGAARGGDIAESQIFANSFGSIQVTTASTVTVNATGGVAVNGAILIIGS